MKKSVLGCWTKRRLVISIQISFSRNEDFSFHSFHASWAHRFFIKIRRRTGANYILFIYIEWSKRGLAYECMRRKYFSNLYIETSLLWMERQEIIVNEGQSTLCGNVFYVFKYFKYIKLFSTILSAALSISDSEESFRKYH